MPLLGLIFVGGLFFGVLPAAALVPLLVGTTPAAAVVAAAEKTTSPVTVADGDDALPPVKMVAATD